MSSRQAINAAAHAPVWLDNARSRRYIAQALDALDSRDSIRQRAMAQSARHHRRRSSSSSFDAAFDATMLPEELADYYSSIEALAPENQRKNRYCDIVPFDRTRIPVPFLSGSSEGTGPSRYLNANFVRELAGGKYWIATQAALPFTAHALLSLLLHPVQVPGGSSAQVRTIVQLTLTTESGRVKAHPYFPDVVGETQQVSPETPRGTMPPIAITLLAQREISDADAIVSTLRISASGGPDHVFNHFLYTSWPDHGVPADGSSLVRFARLVDRANRDPRSIHPAFPPAPLPLLSNKDPNASPPSIVGCSAGVGRTGAFIAISSLLRAYKLLDEHPPPVTPGAPAFRPPVLSASPLGPMEPAFQADAVIAEVDALREQRSRMVQTHSQLVFIYNAISSAFQ
ncbi:phosphatases II [Exidia glandulosa HHB12029]|uniref:Phosphatases II n=1 Tax=Exidia glandulosa HHB12029 TaxID=1314781 RepID=A0A165MBZ2_EXIGL|nr:phosphatases II [Exidia glandulosa HHB12029]